MSDHLLVDEPRPGIRRLTLNRPARRNALSRRLVADLLAAVNAIDADDAVRVTVIAGNGPSFCAGADLDEHFVANDEAPDIGMSPLWDRLETLRVPVIAAVHGWVVTGGFLLACCCDLIVATSDTKFRDTHAALGLIPTGGESQRLPRRVGIGLARELLLTSRVLHADEAHRAGLINRVVDREELEDEALALADRIAANSPRSVTAIKRLVNHGSTTDLATGLRFERMVNRFGAANVDPDPEREARLARVRNGAHEG
jgi:enoyl-CoA hydratase/carnithine racemase